MAARKLRIAAFEALIKKQDSNTRIKAAKSVSGMPQACSVSFKKSQILYEAETSNANSSALLGSLYRAAHTAAITTLPKLCSKRDEQYPLVVALRLVALRLVVRSGWSLRSGWLRSGWSCAPAGRY